MCLCMDMISVSSRALSLALSPSRALSLTLSPDMKCTPPVCFLGYILPLSPSLARARSFTFCVLVCVSLSGYAAPHALSP